VNELSLQELHKYKIEALEKQVEVNTTSVAVMNENMHAIRIALEKISFTLEKIESLEKRNEHADTRIDTVEKDITHIKNRQSYIFGAMASAIVALEIFRKFFLN